ncbi:MAG: hypothetical protein IRZ04_04780 [Rhodospirillales bacterium]|nr:hypothetical protein [Rhodospirillales bacterium]
MRENEADVVENELLRRHHLEPSRKADGVVAVVVAAHEALASRERGENRLHARRALLHREVAEVPDLVVGPDGLVPRADERLVHRGDRCEGTAEEPERAGMAEMRVAGEKERHTTIVTA